MLFRIQRDIERLTAEKTVEGRRKGGADALEQYEKAANTYMEIWRSTARPRARPNKKEAVRRASTRSSTTRPRVPGRAPRR
jgi:hypothetical protein